MFVPLTPLDFKRRAAALFRDKVGVIDGDRRFTYGEFSDRASRLAAALLSLGLEAGDRVAFLASNSYPLLEAYFGVLEAGGILLPLNIRLSPDEIAYILTDSGSRFLFVEPALGPIARAALEQLENSPRIVWLGEPPPGESGPQYDSLLASVGPLTDPYTIDDENEVAELFYTSGTTGRPKGVMLTHRNLYLHALGTLAAIQVDDSVIQLHTIPLFHVNGWGTPQALTAVGGTHVMLRRFEPAEALRLIEAERVTHFFAVPTMLNMLLNHPDVTHRDLSSLRTVHIGGSLTPRELIRRGETVLGCRVLSGYGLSETSPVLTFANSKSHLGGGEEARLSRQATAGLPLVGSEVELVDDEGNALPHDGVTVGEIVAKSNIVMAGYWNDPEATGEVMRGGWFHTGDMGTIDSEGYVTIVDRKKDIIISGGENIASAEIERVLYDHPAVSEAAVIGVPDDTWGEVPVALVTLRPGHEATDEEIKEFCRSRLAGFKVPRALEFRQELPKGGTGKILKRELREPYWPGEEKRVH